ncbi:hypothetical protein PMAYCL1PPCAC_05106 [Pristionchus mayeri]|uniref:lysoplasmalogenase n=1 Tax=Pristionchus mayeri TaxID=1317129 RepID=A0AAN5CBB9_9BILA|nr:hypothetical protein PMAYCL1PPCAC_05106 [Pristionchus mayeri]
MPDLHKAGVVYLAAIGNFFYQSNGFVKFYNEMYPYWKCVPVAVLILFVALHGAKLPLKTRVLLTIGLTGGCIGDYFIGIEQNGIIPGAVVFGIQHILYLLTFVPDTLRVCWPLVGALLAWNAVVGHFCMMPAINVVGFPSVALMSVYGLILSSGLIFSASQALYGSKKHPAYSPPILWRLLGFVSFVISDNCLIHDWSGFHVPYSEAIILITYFSSQYLFVRASISSEWHSKKAKKTKSK